MRSWRCKNFDLNTQTGLMGGEGGEIELPGPIT